jgi:hypothetical protein
MRLPPRRKGGLPVAVVACLAILVVPEIFDFCWSLLRHKHWQIDWERLIVLTPFIVVFALFDFEDYYGWRNRITPPNRITPDRDEAQSLRVKRSTPEPPEVI